ncbi:MAG: FKBP-type peptidyl-prolyl cis-trans isomerase [Bifidobacterium sp.]|nr:FKBP-type peptidyl-prolyl cis-trans isomerase [Bifidobacterium sp.]
MTSSRIHKIVMRAGAAAGAVALCAGLAACGGSSSSSSSASASSSSSASSTFKLSKLTGVTVSGTPGKQPTVKFDAPLSDAIGAGGVLQEGNGDEIVSGDRLCLQYTVYDAQTGEKSGSTWDEGTPDCSVTFNEKETTTTTDTPTIVHVMNELLKGKKLNTTIGTVIGPTTDGGNNSLYIITPISQSKDLTRAEGTKVKDVPSDLPKVTLASNGKPSIDMNGYKGSDKLVSQTLIQGKGAEITDKTTSVVAHYTGWLLDGTQFDSSWDRGEAATFQLSSVIKGWQEGLKGHTVGSQVLLVVPPDLGYGDQASGSVPANSTLVFVVDILGQF